MKGMTFAVVSLAFALTVSAGYRPSFEKRPEQVRLVEEGVAKCRVVVSKTASNPERFGATELAKYFAKATGCGELNGAYPIVLDCMERRDGLDPWKEDEFEIEVTKTGTKIMGYGPRGTLYGVYEILKEYAGMRWLVPGEDGEYCVHTGRTIALPVGKVKKKPYLKIRETRTTADEGALWTVRNNMQSQGLALHRFSDGKGRRTKDCDRLEELCEKGVGPCGHIQSMLLTTDLADKNPPKDAKARAEAMFAKHPEWFPVVDGKRKVVWTANSPNPCVSNKAYLDHAAEVICRLIDRPHGRDAFMTLGNNDTTLWCQCEKCRALDAPGARGTKGEMSDRYWHMVNGIAKRVWNRFPDAKFCGWAYQNYWYPPVKTKIDPRLKVFISFNNQCWRHHCLDPKCTVNAEMRKIYSLWAKTGLPLVINRDEISSSGPGSDFLPSESILWQNFRDYKEMGCSGSHFCVSGPYPRFVDREKNKPPFYGANDEWYAMWQTCYLSARSGWDNTRDYAKDWEEANALYYGKTSWEGAMREFRRTLEKAFFETPGCMGWGSGAPLGRCLDQAGMELKLKGLLEKAVAIAKTDSDPRALRHVEMEKSIFERTWLKARQVYLDNFKELNVYRRKDKITVDGDLDEADWKDADVLSNFKASPWSKVGTPDIQQTFVRVTYDPDFLYLAVEAMEPEIAKMKAGKTVDRQHGYKQLGNHLELFYSFPDMAEGCYQLMVNSEGQMYDLKRASVADSDSSFLTNAKWAVKMGADRWTLEIAIPCTEIGQNCVDGATWRLNVARQREVEGAERESSSCCNGRFYAPATFVNMKFTPGRAKGIAQGNDMAPWKNAGFEAFRPNPADSRFTWTKWTSPNVPKEWSDGSRATPGELVEEGGNHYLRIHGSPKTDIFQYFLGNGKGSLHTTFRARGSGKLTFWTCSYTNFPTAAKRGGYCAVDGTSKSNTFDLTAEWKTYSFDTPKLGYPTERVAHRIRMRGEGSTADIDDVYITPHFSADWNINSSVAGHVTEIIVQTKVPHLPVILAGDSDVAAARARARNFMEVGHPVYILDTCKEEDILALARQLKKKYNLRAKLEVTGSACWPASRVYRNHQEKEGLFTWVHAVEVPDGFTSEDLNLAPTPVRASKAFARRFVQPVSIVKNAAGNWLVDFGRAAFGWVEAKTPSAVDAVAGEKLTDGKSVDVIPFSSIRSARTCAAETDGSFFKRLVFKTEIYSRRRCLSVPRELGEVMPMRYLEIPADVFEPTLANVRMVALEYPFDEAESGFLSDSRALDAVYDLCKYTIRTCAFGGMYIDGDRERLPYEADAYVTQLSNYAMSSDYEVSRVTCDYLMPYPTWPTEYRQISVLMNWTYWMWSGSDELLRKHYGLLKEEKLMERFRRDSDGLLETGGERFHGAYEGAADMVDWPPPERFGFEFRNANAVVNAYYYIGLNEMSEIAARLGKAEDAVIFRTHAARVYDSFQKEFFDSKRGIYVDGQGATHASIHANALAVVANLVPEPALKGVGDWLAGREMECSVYFAQHFLEALFKTGHGVRALALMTAENDRSWIGMIKAGATLTKESWNDGIKANIDWNHAWGTAAINVISRCLAGVTPARPGFEKIRIAPDPAGLGAFDAKVPTAKGPVLVCYMRTGAGERLVVTTPVPAAIIFHSETHEVAAGTYTFGSGKRGDQAET